MKRKPKLKKFVGKVLDNLIVHASGPSPGGMGLDPKCRDRFKYSIIYQIVHTVVNFMSMNISSIVNIFRFKDKQSIVM